jgi:hypothetical protein
MAQTIAEIKKVITDNYIDNDAIIDAYGLDVTKTFEEQFSVVSIESIVFYCIAFILWLQQNIFDKTLVDTNQALALKKPHSARWYAEQAKKFQFGFPLNQDRSGFDNDGYTPDEIAASKVVNYAAVVEQENQFGRVYLRMKIAHDNAGILEPLPDEQFAAFVEWFLTTQRDAGVKMDFVNQVADSLKQKWIIYYDPLLLSATGGRLDGSDNEPVQNAIRNYLTKLPFNGIYVPTYHIDAVQNVTGVVIPELVECEASFGLLPFTAVNGMYTPDAGYLRFNSNSDLVLEFIAQTAIL